MTVNSVTPVVLNWPSFSRLVCAYAADETAKIAAAAEASQIFLIIFSLVLPHWLVFMNTAFFTEKTPIAT
jgi:hypothetical protein